MMVLPHNQSQLETNDNSERSQVYMTRSHLRSVAHIIALKLFKRHASGSVGHEIITRELIAACRDPRNFSMTSRQFKQAIEFVHRELGRLVRRQARKERDRHADRQSLETNNNSESDEYVPPDIDHPPGRNTVA